MIGLGLSVIKLTICPLVTFWSIRVKTADPSAPLAPALDLVWTRDPAEYLRLATGGAGGVAGVGVWVVTVTAGTVGTSPFWASATVIGAGLSVTKFFKFPLVTLLSKRVETLSESAFWASATVIGAGLSVTRFFKFPLVTLLSKRVETLSESAF